MSNAAVARAAGVSEQRYGNYVTDTREPDLATLVRIAKALQTTPNALLGFADGEEKVSKRRARLMAAAARVPEGAADVVSTQLEALAKPQR